MLHFILLIKLKTKDNGLLFVNYLFLNKILNFKIN